MVDRAAAVSADRQVEPEPSRARFPEQMGAYLAARFWRSFSSVGLAGALAALCVSLLPSLIPRAWFMQAGFSGITVALGYAIGVLLRWFGRRAGIHPDWSSRTRRVGWLALGGGGLAAVAIFTALGMNWQSELRHLFGMPDVEAAYLAVPPVAAIVALLLVLLGRTVRGAARAVSGLLTRWMSRAVAHVAGGVAAVAFLVLLFNGTVMAWAMAGMDRLAAAVESGYGPEVVRPDEPERSGSPPSLVSWESLGANGRAFASGGPSPELLSGSAAERGVRPAAEIRVPIRVYVGMESAGSLEQAAELVVAELDRTGAWNRDVLLVVTPSGDGRISAAAVETLELMYGGDTATASMQYSYVPSWLSFLADRNTAPEAGQALFEAVYAAWSERPAADRPRLLVYGESLGSYGGHEAFSGLQDMVARTEGALWVATPNFTEIWRELTDARDSGSPEIAPVYEGGRQVRWGTGAGAETGIWDPGPGWEHPRVVYLQHPSDGVVWWSSDLLLHRPDWLREPAGRDVLPHLPWLPIVTFWLATMDMVIAEDVPPGHGHLYLTEYVDAWTAVAAPDTWTDGDADALRELMRHEGSNTGHSVD